MASDQVLEALYGFVALYDQQIASRDDGLEALQADASLRKQFEDRIAAVFVGMRHDLRSTDLTIADGQRLVRVYGWGVPAHVVE